ncbi:MAG: leucine-rich repeat protein [Ruminococcus sp.]|nr:leucine-rich repeat protein [Ruminococcus sp.]
MFKKLTAFVMALCVIGGTALYAPEKPLNIITANAETASALGYYTTVTEGFLTFRVYADHAEVSKCDESAEGEITIPAEINVIPVTKIDWIAFSGCTGLTSINIPDNVTSIGEWAFLGCTNLTSINIPDGVTSIEGNTFAGCTRLTSINIPDSVTIIREYAFIDCTNLTSINIPDSVTNIEHSAFCNCSLTEITILNPECEIYDGYSLSSEKFEFDGTIHGYANSTAQAYAEKYGYKFAVIGDEAPAVYLAGDANGDGDVSISDAVAILQNLANADEYPLSKQGKLNADVDGVAGVTGKDAAVIQMYDAGVVTSLPV